MDRYVSLKLEPSQELSPEAVMAMQAAMPELPDHELAGEFRPRGPRVHVEALRAMARARTRRGQVSRRSIPDDGSFEALVAGGLLSARGQLTDDGRNLAEVMTNAPLRIRMHGSAAAVPLIFEAHLAGDRALILATDSPAQVLAQAGRSGMAPPAGLADRAGQIGLDMAGLNRLPFVMASWAGLSETDVPERREYRVPWTQVEARFTSRPDAGPGSVQEFLSGQPWSGWAVSTEPATVTMTMIGAGAHCFRLSRPSAVTAQLTWVPAQAVWEDLVGIVRDAVDVIAA